MTDPPAQSSRSSDTYVPDGVRYGRGAITVPHCAPVYPSSHSHVVSVMTDVTVGSSLPELVELTGSELQMVPR